jgi:hypothetical protein
MSKYLVLWEVDTNRAQINAKERGAAWLGMLAMIKQDMKDGKVNDWGSFVGETKGYSIMTGEHVEMAKNLQRYYPFITFKVHEVASVNEVTEVAKSLTG